MEQQKILIVGAGISGIAIAKHFIDRGHSITLIDSGINRSSIIAAGMIKKSLVLNQGYDNVYGSGTIASELTSAQDELLLDISIKKQNKLREIYEKIDSKVRPLIIIQLPDNKANDEDLLISKIQSYLSKKHSINTDNGRLAIYLSNEKANYKDNDQYN